MAEQHDYPACAIFRGGARCTCVYQDPPDERNFRALWGGCQKGDRCQCTSAAQQEACEHRDEEAIARINANVAAGLHGDAAQEGGK